MVHDDLELEKTSVRRITIVACYVACARALKGSAARRTFVHTCAYWGDSSVHSAQSCNLTNFCILGDFEQKMADNSDFKKTPHFICLKLNQICFTSLFCCCQVFICFKIKFLTTNVKTLITDYLMKIGFENPRFSLFSDAICSKS